jgi:hypothetical protein
MQSVTAITRSVARLVISSVSELALVVFNFASVPLTKLRTSQTVSYDHAAEAYKLTTTLRFLR